MSYETIKGMFEDILNIEQTMLDSYIGIFKRTNNKKVKTKIDGIIKDEKKHSKIAKEILKILG